MEEGKEKAQMENQGKDYSVRKEKQAGVKLL